MRGSRGHTMVRNGTGGSEGAEMAGTARGCVRTSSAAHWQWGRGRGGGGGQKRALWCHLR